MQLCNPLRRRYEVLGNIIVASHCTRISAGCTLPAGKHSHCAWYMGDRRQSCSEPGGAVSPVTMVQAPSVATVLVPPTPIGASSNASPGGHHWQQTHGRGQAWSWDMALGRHRRTPPLCLQQPGPLPADGEHHRVQPDILGCHCCRYGERAIPGHGSSCGCSGRPRNQPSRGRGGTGHGLAAQANIRQPPTYGCIGSGYMQDARPGTAAMQVGNIVTTCSALPDFLWDRINLCRPSAHGPSPSQASHCKVPHPTSSLAHPIPISLRRHVHLWRHCTTAQARPSPISPWCHIDLMCHSAHTRAHWCHHCMVPHPATMLRRCWATHAWVRRVAAQDPAPGLGPT